MSESPQSSSVREPSQREKAEPLTRASAQRRGCQLYESTARARSRSEYDIL